MYAVFWKPISGGWVFNKRFRSKKQAEIHAEWVKANHSVETKIIRL